MDLGQLFAIIVGAIFVSNFVLARFLGLCPFVGVSKDSDSALGMGMAVIFVMTMASIVTWFIYTYILVPLDIVYLRTIAFILVIATLVQFVEMVIEKVSPTLHKSLGIYLPLITTNCAVLGVAVVNVNEFMVTDLPVATSFIYTVVHGLAAGLGFTLALVLMASIRERLELVDVPESMRGIPITFIVAGLMAMAFLGFSGLKVG
ncbi:MAG: electron transport complex subunit RsxA [Candidatus Eisenbacteria bacterium]|nr:electron transport complex subunit RsxA [Candidatus Eisenbacteria bacterium]